MESRFAICSLIVLFFRLQIVFARYARGAYLLCGIACIFLVTPSLVSIFWLQAIKPDRKEHPVKIATPINTAPADRALTALDIFDRVAHRRQIERAKRAFFAHGGRVTVYAAGTSLPVARYAVGAFGRRIEEGVRIPLPA